MIFDEAFAKTIKEFRNSNDVIERKLYFDIIKIMKQNYDKFSKVGEVEHKETIEWLNKELNDYKIYPQLQI